MFPENLQCNLCNENIVQSQDHLLSCQKIIDHCKELYENINIEHDDIYGNVEKQLNVVRLYHKVLNIKDKINEEQDKEKDQDPG